MGSILGQSQIEYFRENGFCVVDGIWHGLFQHEPAGHFVGKVSSPADVGPDDSAIVDCQGSAGPVVFIHPPASALLREEIGRLDVNRHRHRHP
ncbi:hypothetical protein ACFSL4_22330 [Streptomyces caeni]|uniref:Uncharacterized protein n=1 Tax=Streptomyces caeni TaxID=2307231 RepID=A0ABW4IW70_9ACTN